MSKIASETAIEQPVDVMAQEEGGLKKWLRLIDDNLEKPFLVFGMLAIILIISYQTFYRYVLTDLLGTSGGAAWTEVASLPHDLYALSLATLGDHLYAAGGYATPLTFTNVYRFDGTSWTQVAGLPATR